MNSVEGGGREERSQSWWGWLSRVFDVEKKKYFFTLKGVDRSLLIHNSALKG